MPKLIHADGTVDIQPVENGKHRVSVELRHPGAYILRNNWITSYPVDLIECIMNIKQPAWVCDEIMRDEDPGYVQHFLSYDILGYVSDAWFEGKRALDFGSGCGASTMVLSRMFPRTEIIGIELVDDFISVAERRAAHHGRTNVRFIRSPSPDSIPSELSQLDAIFFNAVFEHLLPHERPALLGSIWSILKPGGILFINQLPHRYFPLESHTTGLPLINYLPDRLALWAANRFSSRVQGEDWETLLRKGIRGATVNEILTILRKLDGAPELMNPTRLGLNDRIDLWYAMSSSARASRWKKYLKAVLKVLRATTGATLVPYHSLAIRKG